MGRNDILYGKMNSKPCLCMLGVLFWMERASLEELAVMKRCFGDDIGLLKWAFCTISYMRLEYKRYAKPEQSRIL